MTTSVSLGLCFLEASELPRKPHHSQSVTSPSVSSLSVLAPSWQTHLTSL